MLVDLGDRPPVTEGGKLFSQSDDASSIQTFQKDFVLSTI